jgi:hypothetical protein
MASHFPEAAWIARVGPTDRPVGGPRLQCNLFTQKSSTVVEHNSIALYINQSPHINAITVSDAARHFNLPDLHGALADFYSGKSYSVRHGQRLCSDSTPLPFHQIRVWYNFKIQRKSVQDVDLICPSTTVQALPPSEKHPYGRCNMVLVADNRQAHIPTSSQGMQKIYISFIALTYAQLS